MDLEVKSVLDALTRVLRDVFMSDELIAHSELTAHDVEGWDSLGNVRLFMEIERIFRIRFSTTEITSLKNVGQLAEVIVMKSKR